MKQNDGEKIFIKRSSFDRRRVVDRRQNYDFDYFATHIERRVDMIDRRNMRERRKTISDFAMIADGLGDIHK